MVKSKFFALLASAWLAMPLAARADATFDKAVRLYQQKNYSAALPLFGRAVSEHPNPTAFYYEGLCYQQLGQNDKAAVIYKYILAAFGNSQEAKLVEPILPMLSKPVATTPAAVVGNTALTGSADSKALTTVSMRTWQLSDEEYKKLPNEAKVPFTRAASSHLFVDGFLNGHPMHMMFDTGAEMCVFSKKDLDAVGIKVDPNAERVGMSGVGGRAGASLILATIALGDVERKVPIFVADQPLGFPIVGQSFFKDFQYQIDNRGGFISLQKKPRPGVAGSQVYESTDVIKVPYQDHGNDMVVQAKVNGRDVPMIFDTGSFAICFSALHAMALGLKVPPDAQMIMTSGAGGSVRAYRFRVDRIELGPMIRSQVEVVVNQAATPSLPLLGQPFFGDRRFTVDTDHHVIKFAH